MAKHLIHRVTFAFTAESTAQAKRQQDKVSRLFRSSIKAALNQRFNRLSRSDDIILIDRLEVDLGQFRQHLDETKLVQALPEMVEKAVRQQVKENKARIIKGGGASTKKTHQGATSQSHSQGKRGAGNEGGHASVNPSFADLPDDFQDFLHDMADYAGEEDGFGQDDFDLESALSYLGEQLNAPDLAGAETSAISQQADGRNGAQEQGEYRDDIASSQANEGQGLSQTAHDEAALFCLRTGVYPWWYASHLQNGEPPINGLYVTSEEEAKRLLAWFERDEGLFSRWIAYSATAQKKALLDALTLTPFSSGKSRLDLADLLLRLASDLSSQQAQAAALGLASPDPFLQSAWRLALFGEGRTSSVTETLHQAWQTQGQYSAWMKWLWHWDNTQPWCRKEAASWENTLTPVSPLHAQSYTQGPQWHDNDVAIEAVPISNAGLYFVIPVLTDLFTQLNWLEEGWFKDELYQQKAVHLLNYMVMGDVESSVTDPESKGLDEAALPLVKVLCGLHPRDVVWPSVWLSDDEKSQADLCLFQRATPLLNTSKDAEVSAVVAAFREGVLQRPGLFAQRGGLWLLRVLPEGRDILLEQHIQLFSSYLLPWMPVALDVEWGESLANAYPY